MHRPLRATLAHKSVPSKPGVASTSVTPILSIYPSSILIRSQHGPTILTSFLLFLTQSSNDVCEWLCAYIIVYIRTYQRVRPDLIGSYPYVWLISVRWSSPPPQTVCAATCFCCSRLAGSPSPPQELGSFEHELSLTWREAESSLLFLPFLKNSCMDLFWWMCFSALLLTHCYFHTSQDGFTSLLLVRGVLNPLGPFSSYQTELTKP